MTRTQYLESRQGQSNERLKRSIKTNYLQIPQEPRSKESISTDEKNFFRQEVKRQLKKSNRRAHRGNIILEIDFYTTKDNPPAIHTLAKNYLDLLHKEIEEDKLRGILFKDDSQVKILIANYHLNIYGEQKAGIHISSYALSDFIKDIELTDRIITNRFSDVDADMHRRFIHETERENNIIDTSDYLERLRALEKNKNSHVSPDCQPLYDLQKHVLVRQIQENYLKENEVSVRDLSSIFQHNFSYNKKYSDHKGFQKIWDITRGHIYFMSNFIDLGYAPTRSGESKPFRANLQEQLKIFKEKHTVLFPLLHPINITVTFVPPKYNILDLDNLARRIIPFVTEVFQPPATHWHTHFDNHQNSSFAREVIFSQKFLPISISGYQIIHIPRSEEDPEEGRIDLIITEGLELKSNVWNLVDDLIGQWEKRVRYY